MIHLTAISFRLAVTGFVCVMASTYPGFMDADFEYRRFARVGIGLGAGAFVLGALGVIWTV